MERRTSAKQGNCIPVCYSPGHEYPFYFILIKSGLCTVVVLYGRSPLEAESEIQYSIYDRKRDDRAGRVH